MEEKLHPNIFYLLQKIKFLKENQLSIEWWCWQVWSIPFIPFFSALIQIWWSPFFECCDIEPNVLCFQRKQEHFYYKNAMHWCLFMPYNKKFIAQYKKACQKLFLSLIASKGLSHDRESSFVRFMIQAFPSNYFLCGLDHLWFIIKVVFNNCFWSCED